MRAHLAGKPASDPKPQPINPNLIGIDRRGGGGPSETTQRPAPSGTMPAGSTKSGAGG
jgi:hypothetical protein